MPTTFADYRLGPRTQGGRSRRRSTSSDRRLRLIRIGTLAMVALAAPGAIRWWSVDLDRIALAMCAAFSQRS